MLKIKDNVDLKELEKFGFDDYGAFYKRYGTVGGQYFINKEDRTIKRVHPYSLRETPTDNEVFDLIQVGIVEKVDEK